MDASGGSATLKPMGPMQRKVFETLPEVLEARRTAAKWREKGELARANEAAIGKLDAAGRKSKSSRLR